MAGMTDTLTELKRLMGEPASVREPRLEMLKPLHPPCPDGSEWDTQMGQCRPKSGKKGKPTPQPDGKPASKVTPLMRMLAGSTKRYTGEEFEDPQQEVAPLPGGRLRTSPKGVPAGKTTCFCPECNHRMNDAAGHPCRTMDCPKCGAKMAAASVGEETLLEFTKKNDLAVVAKDLKKAVRTISGLQSQLYLALHTLRSSGQLPRTVKKLKDCESEVRQIQGKLAGILIELK